MHLQNKEMGKKNDVKFFLNCSEKILEYNQSSFVIWLKYQYFRYISKGVNGIMAISNRALANYQKYTSSPTIVIPYVFDLSHLLNFGLLPYDGRSLTFLISGRLEEFRDPIYSVKLFSEIKKQRPNISMNLIISGKGSLYEKTKQIIIDLGIEECTSWLNDFDNWAQIHDIYKKAHILLCMQKYSGWGLIVPEAMAAGMLVVCSSTVDSGDNLIIDRYNGLYCNRYDPKTTISSILKVIDNPGAFNTIRKNARDSVKVEDVHYYSERLANFIQSY